MKTTFTTKRSGKSELNARLIIQQGLTEDDVKAIIQLHRKKDRLLDKLEKGLDLDLAEKVRQLEFELQIAWKFTTRDKGFCWNYWRFWQLPFCTCSKLDNDDMIGSGFSYFSENCPYGHGKNLTKEEMVVEFDSN